MFRNFICGVLWAVLALEAVGFSMAEKVDLNGATAKQLETLPGIGPALAGRIVEFREKNGPFKRVEDLLNVRGIGEKKFQKLEPLIRVGRPTAAAGEAAQPIPPGKKPAQPPSPPRP